MHHEASRPAASGARQRPEHLQAEYKEFLALGHGDIFEMEVAKAMVMDRFGTPQQPPWMLPGADLSDFFNYGMDVDMWRFYCAAIVAYKCAPAANTQLFDSCWLTYGTCNCHIVVCDCATLCRCGTAASAAAGLCLSPTALQRVAQQQESTI
jgi:Fip1 motif